MYVVLGGIVSVHESWVTIGWLKRTSVPGGASLGTPASSAGLVILGRLYSGSFSTVLSSSIGESIVQGPPVSCSLVSRLVTSVSWS